MGVEEGRRLAHRAAETSLKGGGQWFVKSGIGKSIPTPLRDQSVFWGRRADGGRKPGWWGLQQPVWDGEEEGISVDMFSWPSGCQGEVSTMPASGQGCGVGTVF